MIKKLRLKFVCIMMGIVTTMLCVILGLIMGFTHQGLEKDCLDTLQKAADNPGFLIETHEAASGLPYFIMRKDILGNLQVAGTVYFDRYEPAELQRFWDTAIESDGKIGQLREYGLKYWKVTGRGGVRCVFVDIRMQQLTMKNLARTCLAVGVAALALMLGLSVLLARWAVAPVDKAWQQQRQFVADASHELKTPLTVIMTNAELLQTGGTEEERQQFAFSILTMSRQMRGLVEGLLELARVDNGSVTTCFAPMDLSALISDSLLPFEPLFFERSLELAAFVEEHVVVKGSTAHLHQVIDILLDNALKYAEAPGCVRVRLARQGSHGVLSVSTPGAAISKEDLRNIFKRFYRIDKARSRSGSFGLGLSIAQRIVEEHKGRIWAESAGGNNTFFVELHLN